MMDFVQCINRMKLTGGILLVYVQNEMYWKNKQTKYIYIYIYIYIHIYIYIYVYTKIKIKNPKMRCVTVNMK